MARRGRTSRPPLPQFLNRQRQLKAVLWLEKPLEPAAEIKSRNPPRRREESPLCTMSAIQNHDLFSNMRYPDGSWKRELWTSGFSPHLPLPVFVLYIHISPPCLIILLQISILLARFHVSCLAIGCSCFCQPFFSKCSPLSLASLFFRHRVSKSVVKTYPPKYFSLSYRDAS